MKRYALLVMLVATMLTGCGGNKVLPKKDLAYYHDALAAGLRPTVIVATEQAIADSLYGRAESNSPMTQRMQSFYANNISASANRLSSLKANEVNPEILAMAGDIKIARLKQLAVIPEIKEPDMSAATLEFFAKMIYNEFSSKDSNESEARMKALFQSSMQDAGTYVSNYTKSVDAYVQLEKSIINRPTLCMEKLGGALASQLPTVSQVCAEILLEQEERCTNIRSALDANKLYKTFIGQKYRSYTFEPEEMTSLKVLTQETKGHCFISDIEISLV